MAGTLWVARCFPVRIGRGAGCGLRLDDAGVWDQHLIVEFDRAAGFSLKTAPDALARVNGQPASEILLRNGDTIELGAVRIQFWLGPVRQSSLRLREALNWGVIATAVLGQIAILYWLLE
jgi:pSer/pThr/pTyr-binding forkhead associated (FHA) protein